MSARLRLLRQLSHDAQTSSSPKWRSASWTGARLTAPHETESELRGRVGLTEYDVRPLDAHSPSHMDRTTLCPSASRCGLTSATVQAASCEPCQSALIVTRLWRCCRDAARFRGSGGSTLTKLPNDAEPDDLHYLVSNLATPHRTTGLPHRAARLATPANWDVSARAVSGPSVIRCRRPRRTPSEGSSVVSVRNKNNDEEIDR